MLVLRKTMDAKIIELERAHSEELAKIAHEHRQLLSQTVALQNQLADWITDKTESMSPEQFAHLFYSRDDEFQAGFFNVLSEVVQQQHDSMTEDQKKRDCYFGPGYPAGETQWCWMSYKLNDAGRLTLETMNWHAKAQFQRQQEQSALATGAAPAHNAPIAQ